MKRLVLLLSLASMLLIGRSAAASTVRVLLPDQDNLQYMAFWIARGAGYFEDEGIDVVLSIPSAPKQTTEYFRRGDSDVAVMPPPQYLELIAGRFPVVLVANLLQNDPINLVVRKSVMQERKLSHDMPIGERLKGLRGLRVGVAPNPPTRLRALFASQGMDADRDIQLVILHGPEQNYAFGDGRVDALYAHTPYLEEALVNQDAEMLVNQSGGEVPELAMRQIHAIVCTRSFVERYPGTTEGIVRAIARAEKLLHADRKAAREVLLRQFPSMDPRKVETIVTIYEPAVPQTPRVSVDGLKPALALFPASRPAPSLDGIDLTAYVAPRFAEAVIGGRSRRGLLVAAGAAVFVACVLVGARMQRRRRLKR
jgi:ABC-type nitrate/sulfonate/bicarbonate transport system substrate-binding protein